MSIISSKKITKKTLFQLKVAILAKLTVVVVEGLQELFKDQESVDNTVAADDLIIIDIEKSV